MAKTILIIGTLDTKGAEFEYVRDLIQARGLRTLVMDTGVMGLPLFPPDFSADQVAEAGGGSLAALRKAGDRGAALEVMGQGGPGPGATVPGRGQGGRSDQPGRLRRHLRRRLRHAGPAGGAAEDHRLHHGRRQRGARTSTSRTSR